MRVCPFCDSLIEDNESLCPVCGECDLERKTNDK